MTSDQKLHFQQNVSLDPEDWAETRQLAHKMLDDMMDYIQSAHIRPAWRPVPIETKKALAEPLPRSGQPLDRVYAQFLEHILPYPTGNLHPGFFGWVMGNGTVTGMLADMLASGMNPHLTGYDQSAYYVERQVIEWLAELMGFPIESSGLLVSGATMANINALAVARNEKAGFAVGTEGLQGQGRAHLTVYGSVETHGWIKKACELLGLGRNAFRAVPVTDSYSIDIEACRTLINEDIQSGRKPFCLIGTAGTVNTGGIDDFAALRFLADEYDLWLHVDGAFGSLAALSPESLPLVAAQSQADSIGFDLHKWGYMPFEAACILVRHKDAQIETYGQNASYLASSGRGIAVDMTYFSDRGLQLTRSFRALKVWMSLKEQGADKLGQVIQQNIDQARYLGELVEAHPALERLAPVTLNIVCFRFVDDSLDAELLNTVNKEVLLRIQESGRAVPSETVLNGQFAIRVAITNHRSRYTTFDELVEDVVAHGNAIMLENNRTG